MMVRDAMVACRRPRETTGCQQPVRHRPGQRHPQTAAPSLVRPASIADHNSSWSSRLALGGRPGDRRGARKERADRRLLAVIATSRVGVLRRPIEPKQYLSLKYTDRLADAGLQPSVGSVGDTYDNALAETVIGLYKTEVIRRLGPWRSLEQLELTTLEWVDWFNQSAPAGTARPYLASGGRSKTFRAGRSGRHGGLIVQTPQPPRKLGHLT